MKVKISLMLGKHRNEIKYYTNGSEIQERKLPLVRYLLSFLYFPTISVIVTFVTVFPYH
jgi:hypothetical protein